MKKKTYIYKLNQKHKAHPEILYKYGFQYYESEEGDVTVFAQPIRLSQDNPLFKQCVRFIEQAYDKATTEEREKDFAALEFVEELQPDQHMKTKLVLNDDIINELTECQIAVAVKKGIRENGIFFINSPMQDCYYHFETIHECAPDLIDKLINDKIISKRTYRY